MEQREGRPTTAGDDATSGAVLIDIDAALSCWQQLEGSATSELVFLFHEWEPAIRVGIHAYLAYPERDFDSIEPDILAAYQRIRGRSRIPWASAAPAARRVWEKLQCQDDEGARSARSARAWRDAWASTELPVEV
ncbi:hypothetical protein [Cognatiluteimonas telluris]|jgi:hypothetical protein|uniref:hypothetical protein n=1 Tax=Cognatiluteimonas telluris TaxID=1104775 RepID=UPI001409A875|nr:hypothetical protein [Lysobacter telluris]